MSPMRTLRAWLLRFAGLFQRDRRDRELADEIESNLALHIEENVRAGMAPAEARRRALVKFGGVESAKESYRERRSIPMLETFWQDVRFAMRMLWKSRGFTIIATLILALGIGANVTTFSWLETIVLNPLPGISNAAEIVAIVQSDSSGVLLPFISFPDFRELARENKAFAGIVGTRSTPALLELNGHNQWVNATVATANIFSVLGIRVEKGRGFLPSEDATEGGSPVAVISDAIWRRDFGGDASIVGRSIILNRHEFTIIGVAPAEFRGVNPGSHTDIWAPLSMHDVVLNFGSYSSRFFHWIRPLARLRDGVQPVRGQAELAVVSRRLSSGYPDSNKGVQFKLFPLWKSPFGGQAVFLPVLRIVLGMAVGILLIAVANLSCLLLSRAVHRQQEVTVRAALGAGRSRLVRQFFTENLMLGIVGGSSGLMLATWAARFLGLIVPEAAPFEYQFRLDPATAAFTMGLTLLSALLFGLAPALIATRTDLATSLRSSGRALSAGAHSRKLLNGLVISEITLATVLLVGAGLCVKGFQQARRLDLGFDARNVLYAGLNLVPNRYSAEQGKVFDRALQGRLRRLAGVEEAAFVNTPPLGVNGAFSGQVEVPGHEFQQSETRNVPFVIVSGGYFKVMRIPLLEGRDFEDADDESRPNAAIINEVMAKRYWPGLDPIGRQFRMAVGIAPTDTFTVIGVARTAKYDSLAEPPTPLAYFTYLQRPLASLFMSLLIRTNGDPRSAASSVRQAIHSIDPAVEPVSIMPLQEYMRPAFLPARVAATLLVILSAAALVLASIGLYGLMSYAASQRMREIGIRLALGAQPRGTVWMMVREGMILGLSGMAAGQALSLGLGGVLGRFLYGVSPRDVPTFATSGGLVCIIALAAAWIPARRAMRVDPMVALRHE